MTTGLRGEWTGEVIVRPKVVELVAERCRFVPRQRFISLGLTEHSNWINSAIINFTSQLFNFGDHFDPFATANLQGWFERGFNKGWGGGVGQGGLHGSAGEKAGLCFFSPLFLISTACRAVLLAFRDFQSKSQPNPFTEVCVFKTTNTEQGRPNQTMVDPGRGSKKV